MKLPSKETQIFFKDLFNTQEFPSDVAGGKSANLLTIERAARIVSFHTLIPTMLFSIVTNNYIPEAGLAQGIIAGTMTAFTTAAFCYGNMVLSGLAAAYPVKRLREKLTASPNKITQKAGKLITIKRGCALAMGLGAIWGAYSGYTSSTNVIQYGIGSDGSSPKNIQPVAQPERPVSLTTPSHNSPAPSHP